MERKKEGKLAKFAKQCNPNVEEGEDFVELLLHYLVCDVDAGAASNSDPICRLQSILHLPYRGVVTPA